MITISENFTSGVVLRIKELFSDLSLLLWLCIGLIIGFFLIESIIRIFRKGNFEEEEEEEEIEIDFEEDYDY